jgi:hypothetical protein
MCFELRPTHVVIGKAVFGTDSASIDRSLVFAQTHRPWKPIERSGYFVWEGARSNVYLEFHWVETLQIIL